MNEYRSITNELIAGDFYNCKKYSDEYLSMGNTFMELYENVFKKELYQVGRLWENNKISVAEEHIATATVESIMNQYFYDIINENKISKKAVITSLEGEYHQVGAKMVADVFEKNGWNTLFLGANTPTKELMYYLKQENPCILGISVSIYFHFNKLDEVLEQLCREFPELNVWIGGQALRHGTDILDRYNKVTYIKNLYVLDTKIKELAGKF